MSPQHRGARWLLGLGELSLAGCFVLFAAGVALTAVMHAVDPAHWGLWVGPDQLFFGSVDDLRNCREVLGHRIYAVAAISVLVGVMAMRDAWRSALPRLRGTAASA